MKEKEDSLFAVALLIDELKHEESSRRLESMKQLKVISEALGPERTRTELLPFLTDSLDDEDEVLLVLAESLGSFVDLIGGPQHAAALFTPLEALAMVEESTVREKAYASIIQVTTVMTDSAMQDKFAPLIRNMSEKDWFTSRISVCSLFACAYPRLNAATKAEFRGIFGKLCRDDTPMVRRAAAANLGGFAKVVEPENVAKELVPLFTVLSEDEQDSVRLLAIQGAVQLAKSIGADANKGVILPACLRLAADRSWRVRWSVASSYCELAGSLGALAANNKEFLEAYIALLKDGEAEVRSSASANVTKMAKIFPTFVTSHFLPSISELTRDASEHVREALAGVIMGLAPIVGKGKAEEQLVPLYKNLLQDENAQVRLAIVAQLGQANGVVGVESLSTALLPAITNLSADKNWRVREKVIEQVSVLASTLDVEYFNKNLLSLCLQWLSDSVFAIREVASKNLEKLTTIFGKPWCEEKVIPKLLELKSNKQYLQRMTAIMSAEVLFGCLDQTVVESKVLPIIIGLGSDPIPNVRFNVAKALERIASKNKKAAQTYNAAAFENCLKGMEKDSDIDVAYYSKRALKTIRDN